MKNISFLNVDFDGGFWKDRCDLNAKVSLKSVYKRFEETDRFNGLRFEKKDIKRDIFYDSDAAKWMEAVAYLIEKNGGYEEEQKIIDGIVDGIVNTTSDDGSVASAGLTLSCVTVEEVK